MSKYNVYNSTNVQDRLLHGFLLTQHGDGIIFINGTDSEPERRFTLAHEVAHFLIEYYLPRQKAIREFGEGIIEVLNGLRKPTVDERVHGLVKSISVKTSTHLVEKFGKGDFLKHKIWQAENDADELAIELLAPFHKVCLIVKSMPDTTDTSHNLLGEVYELLTNRFLLPESISDNYSHRIVHAIRGGESVREKLSL